MTTWFIRSMVDRQSGRAKTRFWSDTYGWCDLGLSDAYEGIAPPRMPYFPDQAEWVSEDTALAGLDEVYA